MTGVDVKFNRHVSAKINLLLITLALFSLNKRQLWAILLTCTNTGRGGGWWMKKKDGARLLLVMPIGRKNQNTGNSAKPRGQRIRLKHPLK